MEFVITRSSRHDGRPCKEAVSKEFVRIDWRAPKTLAEARLPKNRHWSDQFFASGSNHREEGGMIARDTQLTVVWVIEVRDLAALLALESKYGKLIVAQEDDYKEAPKYRIEIYDDYRE